MVLRYPAILLAFSLSMGALPALAAAPRYSIVALDTLPIPPGEDPFGYQSYAYAINDHGVVVGESTSDTTGSIGTTRPVLWNGSSQAQELWDDQNFGGKGLGVNSAGFVVGRYGSGSGFPLPGPGIPDGGGFIWNPTTREFMDLGDLGGSRVEATGINDAGLVVGSSENFESEPRAFIWNAASGMRDLDTLGGNFSRGTAINDLGQVVGWSALADGSERAFLWDAVNGMQNLGALSTGFGSESRAFAVNDLGQVVGVSHGISAFIWDSINGMQPLSIVGLPRDINNLGQVVDHAGNLWDSENGNRRLDDLLVSGQDWEIWNTTAINDAGQIAGFGLFNGDRRAFVATPIPEPDAILLAIAAAILTTCRRVHACRLAE